jgi:hypothetical protein
MDNPLPIFTLVEIRIAGRTFLLLFVAGGDRLLLAEACPSTQNDVTDCLLSELTISARTTRISCSNDCLQKLSVI